MSETNPGEVIPPKGGEALYSFWNGEILSALKREKTYRDTSRQIIDIYEAKKPDETPFAILYSNTETLIPAVYSQTPIPMVLRRFKDADPIGKIVSEVGTRTLKYLVEADSEAYDTFDDTITQAVLEGLLVNRGVTRFKYVDGGKASEAVFGEAARWDKFFHGYARSWKKVPWIGFEWDMDQDEIKSNFPDVKIDFTDTSYMGDSEQSAKDKSENDELAGVMSFKVYEIWDKSEKKIMFFSPVYKQGPLKIVEDPFGLLGFFPVPKPLNFTKKVTTLIPTPLYQYYRSQAQELNNLTIRLKAIIRAIKYRGMYNNTIEGIDKVLQADDNELIPVENVQSMPDGTGMDQLIWTVPINDLAATAQQLYSQREQVKNVIYEITGISDILRGASVASETATAQQLKNQWGTFRLRRMQKEVQRYCRDCMAIMLEIAAAKFDIQTLRQMTGLPYLTDNEKAQITSKHQELMGQYQQTVATMQAHQPPQIPGQPPAPAPQTPPPPQLPPQIAQALQMPSWEDLQKLLHDSIGLRYRCDIETNSTIDSENSQDKQDISDIMNAMSQLLNGLGPLIQEGVMPFGVAQQFMLAIVRRYNFGSQIEEYIEQMQPPQPQGQQGPKPSEQAQEQVAQIQANADLQKAQMQMQMEEQEFQHKQTLMQQQAQLDALKHNSDLQAHSQQMAQLARDEALAQAKHERDLQAIQAKAAAARQQTQAP